MGNNSSHTVSAVNKEPLNVIHIAESVLQRVAEDVKASAKDINEKPTNLTNKPAEKTPEPAVPPVKEVVPPSKEALPLEYPSKPPVTTKDDYRSEDYILSAAEVVNATVRLRQEKETALKELEDQWRKRLHSVEQKYVDMYQLSEDSCTEAVKDVEEMFASKQCLPVCEGIQSQVLDCYKNNAKNSLNCANLVKEFSKCVGSNRMVRTGSSGGASYNQIIFPQPSQQS